jgi:hypothetical protein
VSIVNPMSRGPGKDIGGRDAAIFLSFLQGTVNCFLGMDAKSDILVCNEPPVIKVIVA